MASAVSIKVPPFVENSPATWFIILEAQFQNLSIAVSKTKFYHALANLPVSTVQRIPQTVITSEDFDLLKSTVVSNYEATKPELFETLLAKTSYSGRPSAYLSEIQQMAQKVGVGDDLVRHKFTQSLPTSIRPVLASQSALDLQALGKLADELVPLCSSFDACSVYTKYAENDKKESSSRFEKKRNFNPPYKQQFQGLTPFHRDQKQKVCRAHIFYGNNARSCRTWCQWPDKKGTNVLPPSGKNSRNSSRESSPERLNG